MDKINKNKNGIKNECVQVIVRCRPMNKMELNYGDYKQQIVDVFPTRGVIEIHNPNEQNRDNKKMFTYDAVYDTNSTQTNIYDEVVRPLVSSVLEGFNCCVFAYGQTGTGKTFTMEGLRDDNELQGIIPRAFEQIWFHISRAENTNFLVATSYLEIYMEELRDLLKPNTQKTLELRERENCGIYVPNLHSVLCKNVGEMCDVMRKGNKNRTVGKTNMNEHSSRSHAIFMIKIEMCDLTTNKVKVGKLNLIDLAGSERQSKTGATADRLKEASKINRALSSLGNVISALAENSPHIPYRDSKLTRLLQDSLGGNSKTIMIANIGPSEYNYNETLTTLRYAHRAKTIQNKPVLNEDPQDAKLKEYQEEIVRLRMLITERQNREKSVPIKRKKTKKEKSTLQNTIKMEKMVKNNLHSNENLNNTDDDDKDVDNENNDDDDDDDDDDEDEEEGDKDELHQSNTDIKSNETLLREKEITNQLAMKLNELESQLVTGGRNIIDTYSERQLELEKKLQEIGERKKREVEMQQELELQEESTIEIKETITSLQQEVEVKTRKLKKCYAKYMALKQELVDTRDEHNRDRRELEMTQNELIKELKRLLLIVDNFVPVEVKTRLYTQARYDEEQEEWALNTNIIFDNVSSTRRPVSVPRRRPMSEYAMQMINQNVMNVQGVIGGGGGVAGVGGIGNDISVIRFKGENIINYELDMPLRTTYEYKNPKVSASLQAVLAEAMRIEDDIDICDQTYPESMRSRLDKIIKRGIPDNTTNINNRVKSSKPDIINPKRLISTATSTSTPKKPASAYPKTRGLVTK